MEAALPHTRASGLHLGSRRLDLRAAWIWLLSGGLVLYLGLDGGGFDIVVRSEAGVIVWWAILLGAAAGVLPATRMTAAGWVAVGLFGGFVAWSAIATTWSISAESSVDEVSRLVAYGGVLLLAVISYGDRATALRHVVGAVAAAIVVIALAGLLSRLRPGLFPGADATASLLPGSQRRLSWPLNYWNALAALVALGVPLLLSIATSARRLLPQSAAAAALPAVVLCAYFTFSRGGALALLVGLVVFIALAPDRIPKLATVLLCAAGSAALVAGAVHRSALEHGLTSKLASSQGRSLLVAVILVCVGVGVAQAGIGMATRHAALPRWMRVPPRRAAAVLAGVVVLALVVALAAGAPHRLSHAWQEFKHPSAPSLLQDSLARFGSLSGNLRYTYWKTGLDALSGHTLGGYGPGTFHLVWLPNAPVLSPIQDAHSLYVQTLVEVGIVGLALLLAFLVTAFVVAVRRLAGVTPGERANVAAVAGACAAFAISAAVDWVWQVPVIPVALMLLIAALLVPAQLRGRAALAASAAAGDSGGSVAAGRSRYPAWAARGVLVLVSIAALVTIAVPLSVTNDVRRSERLANAGNTSGAISAARDAISLNPSAVTARLQLALVLELRGDYSQGLAQARAAARTEPRNWEPWLIISRLEAESGHAGAAIAAFRNARALNPRSPIFWSS